MTQASETPERTVKTQWHRLLGKHLELLLTPVGITVQTEPQVMSDPPKVDILLLRREGTAWTPAQASFLPDGIRQSRASHILIEFKFTESVNGQVMQQVIGYDYFYRQAQQLGDSDVQSFVVSSRKPRTHVLLTYGYTPTEHAGVYHSANPLLYNIPLLVLNELDRVQHNAFIQCFASRRRVREEAFRLLSAMDKEFISEAFWGFYIGLRSTLTKGEIKMDKAQLRQEMIEMGLTPERVMELGEEMRDLWISLLKPAQINELLAKQAQMRHEVLSGTSPEERLAGIPAEERLAGIPPEKRLVGLTPEELAALAKQIEATLRAQPLDNPTQSS